MSGDRQQSQVDVRFLLISIGLHLLFVLLAPGLGYGPPALPLARGGTTLITLVPDNGGQPDKEAVASTQPARKPQVPASKPAPVPSPKPPEKKAEVSPKPTVQVEKPPPPVAPAPPDQAASTARVLTSDRGSDAAPETVGKQPAPAPPADTSPPKEQGREPVASAGGQEPAGPPLAGDVVGGLGVLRIWQAKEFALLVQTVRLRMVVTVSADAGNITTRAVGSTGSKRADDWAIRMVPRQLKFQPAAEPYEVTIEVLFDPDTKRVAFSTPDERVRFLRR